MRIGAKRARINYVMRTVVHLRNREPPWSYPSMAQSVHKSKESLQRHDLRILAILFCPCQSFKILFIAPQS